MRFLDDSTVQPDEIDTLGHMNVRFYLKRVMRGHEKLLASLGFDLAARDECETTLRRIDTYIRYHREQMIGAALQVRGGPLAADETSLRMYYEVLGPAGEPAATYIIVFAHERRSDRARAPLPGSLINGLQSELVELPPHGLPRSLSLEAPRLDLTYADVDTRVQQIEGDDSMLGSQMEREIGPEDCDSWGFLQDEDDLMFGARLRAAKRKPGEQFGPPIHTSEHGHRFAWAWLESRAIEAARPRAGDVLRSIPADIGLQRKTRHTRRWIFNVGTGGIVGVEDYIGIALDIDARRSIEIPPRVREALETRFVPEFA